MIRHFPHEPIAIIGIGCRFPGGAHGPEAFWKLLSEGVDAVSEIPADRWNAETFFDPRAGQKGKSISRWAGTVGAIDRFDAGFFGVSPRGLSRDPRSGVVRRHQVIEDNFCNARCARRRKRSGSPSRWGRMC